MNNDSKPVRKAHHEPHFDEHLGSFLVLFIFDSTTQRLRIIDRGGFKADIIMKVKKITRLDQRPSFYVGDLFDAAAVLIQPSTAARFFEVSKTTTHVATLEFRAPEPFSFDVHIASGPEGVNNKLRIRARQVMLDLGAMDAAARAPIEGNGDPDEGNLDTDVSSWPFTLERRRLNSTTTGSQ